MKSLIMMVMIYCSMVLGCSGESPVEKARVKTNSAERSIDKMLHHANEAACGTLTGDNKVQCLAKKMKNRSIETKDRVVDKASEIKNKADSDGD